MSMSLTHLIAALGVCVLGAVLCALAPRRARRWIFIIAVALEAVLAFVAGFFVLAAAPAASSLRLWDMAALGRPVLTLDPTAGLFLAVTAAVFLIGAPYAARHGDGYGSKARSGLFAALYQLLFAAILLVLSAGDVLSFLVSWEVMSLLLYALILFDHEDGHAQGPAYLMLAMGEVGMIAGAAGLLLLAAPAGELGFAALRGAAHGLGSGTVWVVFALTFLGFGVKAGLVPVNQWLPDAYAAAPRGFRPVLAGATTNLGIYAILRIDFDLLSPTGVGPGIVVLVVGSLTALVGILYATVEADMRRMLAHSSIENMGIVVAALGAGLIFAADGHAAVAAIAVMTALYHMTNHAFYKALLFTGAGGVEEATASCDMDRLGGLIRRMPVAAFLFLVGIFAIAALPPLNGFVSEWLALETMLRAAILSSTVVKVIFALAGAALALTAGLAVTCFVKAFAMSFLGLARSPEIAKASEPSWSIRGPMAAFAVLCILLGVLPTFAIPVFDRAVAPLVGARAVDALVPPFFARSGTPQESLPPAFRKEFRELGAEVGKGVLPGRGLVVLHRGGKRNPVVFAMSTSYMAATLIVLLLVIYGLFRMMTRRRTVTRRAAWDGGLRRLRPDYTYTATGFSNPVRVIFHALLRPQTVEDSTEAVAAHFRTAVRRVVSDTHLTERLFLNPLVAVIRGLANALRAMHHGPVNAYTAYVLIALLVTLAVGLGLAGGGLVALPGLN